MTARAPEPAWYPSDAEGWSNTRVKSAVESIDSGVWGEDPYDDEHSTAVLRSNEIDEGGVWRDTEPARRLLSETEKRKAQLHDGDLLLVKSSGSAAHIGKTAVVTKQIGDMACCFSNFTSRIRVARHATSSRFLWYYLNNCPGRDQLFYHGTTTTGLINLSGTTIGICRLLLPPLPEQELIAEYLDASCCAVDAAVASKRQQIETLDLVRASIIETAVTRGLNARARHTPIVKDWIRSLPAHWTATRVKRIISQVDYGISVRTEPAGNHPVLKMGNIQAGEIVFSKMEYVDQVDANLLLAAEDLLYNRTNSSDQVAKAALFRGCKDDGVTFASYLVRLRVNHRISAKFLNYVVNCAGFLAFARKLAIQSVQQSNLNSTRYCQLLVPLPPLGEQDAICEHLDDKLRELGQVVLTIGSQIGTLVAYRKSLIHECVTGQRRVTEADLKRSQSQANG